MEMPFGFNRVSCWAGLYCKLARDYLDWLMGKHVCLELFIERLTPNAEYRYPTRGALMTAGVLTAGLISFRQGNSHLGQKLMRARVVVQGATVALMVGTAYYYGEKF
ncbi:UNVERIFIED_CONTAM: RING-H2 finger protein ATL48 [Sesamum calycinum]|uniref:RING-H2 finger protein ATL48 n=1 Tax=Sesamum calycinum TaxID=2727403 RepID=A0AAW2P5V0_9LAMI